MRVSALTCSLAAFASFAVGCAVETSEPAPRELAPPSVGASAVPAMREAAATDSVLVRFRARVAPSLAQSALARVRGTIVDRDGDGVCDAFAHLAKGELALVHLPKGASVEEALAALRADPAIAYAEPNPIVHLSAVPDDPRFAEQWALHNTGQSGGLADADVDAVEAWDITAGSRDVVVGIVDTGIDVTHPDLAANLWVNPGEIAGNRIDDDGNSVVDDVHGFDAIVRSGDPRDDNDHGTHVAGILGAVGGNAVGVTGVSPRVSLMALKFLDANGSGTLANAIAVIDYAVAQRRAGVDLRVLSNSWGGGGFNQALRDAIQDAHDAGILFVAASGGSASNTDVAPTYPAGYDVPNVVSVASTDRRDALASFSNWGPTTVDLAAPGVEILSTVRGGYRVFSGTSMSTPLVAGVAALVLSIDGSLDVAEVKDIVLSSGDPLPSLEGRTVTGRRLNAARAVEAVSAPAPAPELSIESISRVRGDFEFRVELRWRGAEGRLVELHRNGALADIPDNTGVLFDTFRRYDTTYTWRICERPVVADAACSNEVSVVFGPDGDEVDVIAAGVARRLAVAR